MFFWIRISVFVILNENLIFFLRFTKIRNLLILNIFKLKNHKLIFVNCESVSLKTGPPYFLLNQN